MLLFWPSVALQRLRKIHHLLSTLVWLDQVVTSKKVVPVLRTMTPAMTQAITMATTSAMTQAITKPPAITMTTITVVTTMKHFFPPPLTPTNQSAGTMTSPQWKPNI